MHTIRTFIAVPLTDDVSRKAVKLIKRLSESGDGVKWVPTENLHLTLKFLGEVDNTAVPDICNVIRDVCHQQEAFGLSFGGTGGFPNREKPRILYAGVEDPSGSLVRLVTDLEKQLADLGFKPEPRDYTPHLTLGRSRGRRVDEEVLARLDKESDTQLGEMEVDTVNLMASFLDKEGPTYQKMDTVYLD